MLDKIQIKTEYSEGIKKFSRLSRNFNVDCEMPRRAKFLLQTRKRQVKYNEVEFCFMRFNFDEKNFLLSYNYVMISFF